jgi:hypothetical protein
MRFENRHTFWRAGEQEKGEEAARGWGGKKRVWNRTSQGENAPCNGRIYVDSLAGLSAFQAAPKKTSIAENSIHTIKPIAAARPP